MEEFSTTALIKIALTDLSTTAAFVLAVFFGGFFAFLIHRRWARQRERDSQRKHEVAVLERRQIAAKPVKSNSVIE